jgi:hypothetical protein
MNKRSFFLCVLLLAFTMLNAVCMQAQRTMADTGKVELVQEYKVKELLAKHIEVNSKAPIKGYRIKIHFGADKNKSKEVRAKFILKFPQYKAYEKYDQPNFNIRVGDFRTKLDAYKALKEIQAEFPASFIVQDEIEMPELDQAEPSK